MKRELSPQIDSEFERINSIFKDFARKMDEDINYARNKVIEKHLVHSGLDPDELTLRNMIDLLGDSDG